MSRRLPATALGDVLASVVAELIYTRLDDDGTPTLTLPELCQHVAVDVGFKIAAVVKSFIDAGLVEYRDGRLYPL